ncbi:LIC_10091 family protein [Legionella taurinensis]|uniref:DUF7790 domain-containing protein n=1 Tax=Legionella taurinensis TaxID=70611 RepID=A0A3A5L3J0_9GAMM|nr:hypothetical protein [Legionella taurinensis]RJT43317.1 hypothetical protein D6J04_14535 [Legionella taurinensis]
MQDFKTESKPHQKPVEYVPVPRKPIKGIIEDPFSKRLRQFENHAILYPFPNQSGVYINTNESGVINTAQALDLLPRVEGGMHVGFSGWHNFDIMAQRLSSRGLICDINPENTLFLTTALKYVRQCEDKDAFIEKMTAFVKKYHYGGSRDTSRSSVLGKIQTKSIKFCLNVSDEPPYPDHFTVLEEVDLEKLRETSWLYTAERYKHIRTLAMTDKIAVITESICADNVFKSVQNLLINNAMRIDTVYVSNIGEWMYQPEQREAFLTTIQSLLMDNDTILIDAKKPEGVIASPTQRCVTRGTLLKSSQWKASFFSCPETSAAIPNTAGILSSSPPSKEEETTVSEALSRVNL